MPEIVLNTRKEFDDCLKSAGSKLVVIDFFATWCGPCKIISPFFHELSEKYPHVVFAKVDVDQNEETAQSCGISAMPTFQFYKNGNLVHTMRGASKEGLLQGIQEHSGDSWSTLSGGQKLSDGADSRSADPRAAAAAAAERRAAAAAAAASQK
ncbi:hypothetical protein GUITHDRAFT_85403 [Guillardia theta CCMP2712]|uniref:Thioredoxin domain-containing protein n=1 Tax=Guillardia theta (strain CCMP2712) TaxID=905079 RepID=L1JNK6_GUITC|nr:hypothetical protein GUITHDRAFT_85403 [Guillardia theta CCMP2712]EKX50171.1 hypothetical protein GUITHDRAFT_85403 [Guillardia theta CCMP2712]|mmetsp:Transcript_14472/g.49438  ORF Transcript_14472/g.49438 Transcript_14472/m.49438 type:complete len:153 (-) Transcript_14472:157-615(-)|eukprot:XP_005837151.1 hypothetical protein GUITHDRAFT_85403 [Guillardia theta CCMP2712]